MMVNDVAYGYYLILLRLLFASSNTTVSLFASAFSATTVNGGGGSAHHSLFNSETVTMSDDEQTQEEKQQTPHRRRYYSPFFPLNNDNNSQQSSEAALVILNTPIPTVKTTSDNNNNNNNNSNSQQTLPDVFRILWESTSFHVCADGGANRLYDATITTTNNALIPDLITGDLDSLRPDVQSYYEQQGVPIVCVQDQNYHDLDKSLMAVEKWIVEQQQKMTTSDHYSTNGNGSSCKQQEESTDTTTTTTSCFIYGGFGGRFDQEMACINTLYSWGRNKETFQYTQMSIYDEETGVILLPEEPIVNEILIRFPDVQDEEESTVERSSSDQNEVVGERVGEGPTCGLIPIGGRCERVYTSGLKWNLNGDMPLEFGGLVSSSNRIVERVVTVTTSSPLLFSFEIVKR
jgi:thiamine pyrophosphokinase